MDPANQSDDTPELPQFPPIQVIENTQKIADLYDSGKQIWIRSDFERIEHELMHWRTQPSFNIRRVDGSVVSIRNPMFGISDPVWKPFVEFQNYWYMVTMQSSDVFFRRILPHSFPYYSYMIAWKNQAFNNFTADEQHPLDDQFKEIQQVWEQSSTCTWFKNRLAFQKGFRKVNKVVCFALGDMAPMSRYDSRYTPHGSDTANKEFNMKQHAVALTIGAAFRSTTAADVEIFAQDPDYSHTSKALLKSLGISVVGEHGAGGFSEISDDSVVFFCYPTFPMSEIIADIARPAMIIGNGRTHVLNNTTHGARTHADTVAFEVFQRRQPYPSNAETPRTREMWEDYTEHDFKIMNPDKRTLAGLESLKIYIRNDVTGGACQSEGKGKN
ncbi:hypothetical protein F5Y00DRAFT_144559 [Daldinia vernicosa]|uniref:uncharacterized protein n=1 Tax=Daldinia vernicosa TaxID=114800 RepID=UPI0020072B17|nr:uncharacterized protein F5Y00DRAFT_144559 [Daldinia vernicosa]KAI0846368.1 hypothetical protein F5Y00DRAFT_144559 [Daldinia vernicosa]